jgi:hypothetical protein
MWWLASALISNNRVIPGGGKSNKHLHDNESAANWLLAG